MEPTLRDLFAGLAAVGLLMRHGAEGFYAEEAFEVADKLIAERQPDDEGLAKLAKRTRKRNVEENARGQS